MEEIPIVDSSTTSMWVFGYGSLIWKVDFPYEKRVPGFIRGHVRDSGSTDHRGTDDYPGRVVTLVPHNEWQTMNDIHVHAHDEVTWGVAYKVADADVERVRAHLDYREKNGYSIHYVDVFQAIDSEIPVVKQAMIYIGTTSNSEFSGPESIDELASRIAMAVGPSGPNHEYLFNLCEALRSLAPQAHDPHLFELEERVQKLLEQVNNRIN
ncbi:ChaC-like protein [Syncephalis plumigaleata]|nr:ChaC-like protein [Syncephalis plumigaleata]